MNKAYVFQKSLNYFQFFKLYTEMLKKHLIVPYLQQIDVFISTENYISTGNVANEI